MTPAIEVCGACGDAFWADRAHDCPRSDGEYHLGCGGVWDQTDHCNKCGAALAAATGTAKTPKAVECEASQSGPAEQGNAQPLPPSKDSDNHG